MLLPPRGPFIFAALFQARVLQLVNENSIALI